MSVRAALGAGLVVVVLVVICAVRNPFADDGRPSSARDNAAQQHEPANSPEALTTSGTLGELGEIGQAPPDTVAQPSPGTPLPDLWRQLGPAARAGHAPSACRLALETLRCAVAQPLNPWVVAEQERRPQGELERMRDVVEDPTGVLTTIHRGASAAALAAGERARASIERSCGPPAPERRSEALALLRQAALAGVPDAQVLYASWGGGFFELVPGSMADPTFDRWLEEAPTVLARMLDAGHPEAPRLLAEAHGGDGFLWMGFPHDPVRGVAYAQLQRRLEGNSSPAVGLLASRRAALSATQRAEADRLAERLYAEHYEGVPRPAQRDPRFMLGRLHDVHRAPTNDAMAECAPPGPR